MTAWIGILFLGISTASAQSWVAVGQPANWNLIACSADGTQLYGAETQNGNSTNFFVVSTNFGATWVTNTIPSPCVSIAPLAGGQLLAIACQNGHLYTSTNSGATWTPIGNPNIWLSIAGSSDGSTLIAGASQQLLTSTNSGASWRTNNLPFLNWISVASSADGATLAASGGEGPIYTSTNEGSNWIGGGPTNTTSVYVSADGRKIAAFGHGIYASTNAGLTWTTNTPSQSASVQPNFTVAVNSGMFVFMFYNESMDYGAHTFISTNWGASWVTSSVPPIADYAVTSLLTISADGTRWMEAAKQIGPVEVLAIPPALRVGTTGGNVAVSWCAVPSGWTLQQNADLTTPNWAEVTNDLNSTQDQNQLTLTPQAGSRFYRLAGAYP